MQSHLGRYPRTRNPLNNPYQGYLKFALGSPGKGALLLKVIEWLSKRRLRNDKRLGKLIAGCNYLIEPFVEIGSGGRI